MTRIEFSHNGERWWFDPETCEFEYDGPSALIKVILRNMDQFSEIQPDNVFGLDEHPGEMWRTLSPEERKEKVLNYITQVNGVELNESRETQYS